MSLKLPQIYKDAYELTLVLFECTQALPKHARPTLGRRLEENSLELASQVRSLLLVSRSRDAVKVTQLEQAIRHTDELKLLVQLARDLEVVTVKRFGEFSERLEAIGSQLGGLQKNLVGSADAPA